MNVPESNREEALLWVRRARSNLARARAGRLTEDVLYEDVCFDAQQAAEKALKALLVFRGIQPRRTHSIAELLTAVAEEGFDLPRAVKDASGLTDYAVTARYPGVGEPVIAEDWDEALRQAIAVVTWVEEHVNSRISRSSD